MKRIRQLSVSVLLLCTVFLWGCQEIPDTAQEPSAVIQIQSEELSHSPEYSGTPYAVVDGGEPDFHTEDYQSPVYETYSELDTLGRCGVAEAKIGPELMPTEERESISEVTPSGWNNHEYENVDGGWVYNRCHLIGFQLTAENANEKNLITGTRYMNVEGMLPFENQVADYIRETGNHVLYRVTPVYDGTNLVASGVQMEAASVEDTEIEFNVYVYNIQPGIEIDYATGENHQSDAFTEEAENAKGEDAFVLNTNSMKYHKSGCGNADKIAPANRKEISASPKKLQQQGYEAAKCCN